MSKPSDTSPPKGTKTTRATEGILSAIDDVLEKNGSQATKDKDERKASK